MSQTPAKQQKPNGLHPAVDDFVRGVSATYHARDELDEANADLQSRLTIAEGMVMQLKSMLVEVTADRDYWSRYATAMSTRLNASMDMISGVLDVSKDEAKHPGPKRLPDAPQSDNAVNTQP